jgi:hypothetical protein
VQLKHVISTREAIDRCFEKCHMRPVDSERMPVILRAVYAILEKRGLRER